MKKIYTFIKGGLGNQMFIYAASKRIALANNACLVLLADSYGNETHGRHFLLDRFKVAEEITTLENSEVPYENAAYLRAARLNRYYQWFSRFPPAYAIERSKTRLNQHQEIDSRFLNIQLRNDVTFIDGYFQNEAYFSDIAQTLRDTFQVKSAPSGRTVHWAEEIAQSNSVCLHFRRTEIEHQKMRSKHGDVGWLKGYKRGLDSAYYHQAISLIESKIQAPRYFCFSDAPEWVEENFRFPFPVTYVTGNNSEDMSHEDLFLMTQCKHHVISHSTFGWWGAWLAQRDGQIVVAPRNTAGRPKAPFYPAGWTVLNVELPPVQ